MSDDATQLRERLQQLLELIGAEEVKTVAEVALEEIPKKLVTIEEGIARNELLPVSRLAHGLKGDTSTLGIDTMAAIAKTLESIDKPEFTEDSNALVARLKVLYAEAEPILKEFSQA